MWQLLIPLLLDTCTGGDGYKISFKDYETKNAIPPRCYVMSGSVKSLIAKDTACQVPLFIQTSHDTLFAYRYRLEKNDCCTPSGNAGMLDYPLFGIKNCEFEYCIDSSALKQWKIEKTKHAFLFLLFEDNLVIRKVIGSEPDSLQGLKTIIYQPFQYIESEKKNRTPVETKKELTAVIEKFYELDCCNLGNANIHCIPFQSFVQRCDERAIMVAKYLEELPYEYVLLRICQQCGANGITGPVAAIPRNVFWEYHTVAAILYRKQNNYYIIDPTSIPESASLSAHKLENWKRKFAIDGTCTYGKKKLSTIYYNRPDFCNINDCILESGTQNDQPVLTAGKKGVAEIKKDKVCVCVKEFSGFPFK